MEGVKRFYFINNYELKNDGNYYELLDDKNIHVEQKIELFYSSLVSNIFDIFRVVADNNCVYDISGEGLIVYVSMLLSKYYIFPNEHQKNIHSIYNCLNISAVIYYIEKILNDLYACNPSFHVIFFNVFNLFFENKKRKRVFDNYKLIRNVFILHCKKNFIPYFIFDNWYGDDNYSMYLKKYQPLFMFIEDGSSFLYVFNKFYVGEINKEEIVSISNSSDFSENKNNEIREHIYKEYAEKKFIYDEMNEEVRKLCVCFYFLLINNILRNIKCVFLFNMEVEKNTVNAFSIIYNEISFRVIENLNMEASILFDNEYYGRVRRNYLNDNASDLLNQDEDVFYEKDITDFDLLYKEEINYSEKEKHILNLLEKEFRELKIEDSKDSLCNNNSSSKCVNLKNVVLKFFFDITFKKLENTDFSNEEYFLIVKLLFLHNYLIDKLNMKNLCFLKKISKHESTKKSLGISRLMILIDSYVNEYLNVYTFILQVLHKIEHSYILRAVRNVDILNFFNSSILNNLIGFLYLNLNNNRSCFEHSDFNFEPNSFFEESFSYICGESAADGFSFFPVGFSFLKKKVEMTNEEPTELSNGIIVKHEVEEPVINNSNNNTNSAVNINLIKIDNSLVNLFFSLNDLPLLRKSKSRKFQIIINYKNEKIAYDNVFFDALDIIHISDRENIVDVFTSYLKISAKKKYKNILKNKTNAKYLQRREQQEEKTKSTISKYFNISSLHHPIIVTENHPWIKYYCRAIDRYSRYKEEEIKRGVVYRMSKMLEIEEENENENENEREQNREREEEQGKESINENDGGSKKEGIMESGIEKNKEKLENKEICGANDYDIEETEEERMEEEEEEVVKEIKKNPHKKGQNKKEEILKRKELQTEKKIHEINLERYEQLENKINKLASDDSYADMNVWSFDIITGYNRYVDVYNFNNITNLIKSAELQVKISMKVLNSMHNIIMYTKLRNIKTPRQKSEAVKSVLLIYKLTNEIFTRFKKSLKLKDVLQLQTVLLSLGFKNSSNGLFDEYVKYRKELERKKQEKLLEEQKKRKKENIRKKTKAEKKATLKERNKREVKIEYAESSEDEVTDENINVNDLEKYRLKSVKNFSELKIDDTKEHEFQLYYMYYLFDRTTGNIKDKRVFFNLDTWQYNILNLVDRRKSILVSCPTSSGKTFICYYVMDKVLRLNNDSVVIYVAPNDTLALQVYHEVNGRFSSKCFSKNSSNILCSFMTDKWAQDKSLYSQIIIVLPGVLEDLLLSCYNNSNSVSTYMGDENLNMNVQDFVKKIEYIIFDEIHCIGDKEFYGAQIENILHLSNCPFLALSATIGNIKYFYSWLKSVFVSKGKNPNDLHLIKFYERYSDLILHVYTNKNLYHLNPLACLNYRDILYKGISKDFYFNPREIYQIVKILFELAKHKGFYNLVEFLQPSIYFQYTRSINKKQYIYYMHSVKEMIVYLIHNKYINSKDYEMIIYLILSNYVKSEDFLKKGEEGTNKKDEKVDAEKNENVEKREELNEIENKKSVGMKHLHTSLPKKGGTLEKEELYKELYRNVVIDEHFYKKKKSDLIKYTEMKYMEPEYLNSGKLIELLKKLEDDKFLPCIVFNFERIELENMTLNLINELKRRQYDKYYGTEERAFNTKMENKIRQEKYESLLRQREIQLKMKTASRSQKIEQNLDAKTLEMLDEDLLPEKPLDIAEEYDGDFYFCSRKIFYNYESEIDNLIKSAEKSIEFFRNRVVLIEGLKRGIGLHYEALPYGFTIIVESLFRLGFLKVIFSNKNLSLGINIPCKSIIFAGHSLELNSLMFRQMSGRAGRRGFDLYGNIILWNINFQNLKRLITSPLQTLSGQYSVHMTNVCRTMLLYSTMLKKKELDDLKNKKNQPTANKMVTAITNKKKKKMITLSVAEKEAIFDANRNVNIDFYYRTNGLLSMFFNSLYFINAFQEESEENSMRQTSIEKEKGNTSELLNNVDNCNNKTNDAHLTKNINQEEGEEREAGEKEEKGFMKESDELSFSKNEFIEYTNIRKDLFEVSNKIYEYNEIFRRILTFKEKRKNMKKNRKELKQIYFMIKTHFLMFVNILVEMGALDNKGNVINLTELSIFLKKEYDNNFIFTYVLIQKIIHLLIGDTTFLSIPKSISMNKILESTTYEKNYSRSSIVDEFSKRQLMLLFILSHFINKKKENNISVLKIFISFNKKQKTVCENYSSLYFPLLHDLPKALLKYLKFLYGIFLKYMKNYALIVLHKFDLLNKKQSYLLPFTEMYIYNEHPAFTLDELLPNCGTYVTYLRAVMNDYKVRSPFLVSLFGGDEFQNTEELLLTSVNDLNIRRNMIPDMLVDKIYFYRLDDGMIKEEAVCLENSYILDYFLHGKPDYIQKKNRLLHHSWHHIDRFLNALKNIEHVYYELKRQKLYLSDDIFYQALNSVKETLDKHIRIFNVAAAYK